MADAHRLEDRLAAVAAAIDPTESFRPRGVVRRVADGVALVAGLDRVAYEELVAFDSGAFGMAYDLRAEITGVLVLSGADRVRAGDGVTGLGCLPEIPVGPGTLGRILDPLGNPLDEEAPLTSAPRLPLFRPAPEILERKPVDQPLWTGILALDAAIPIGRGQRELIVGDRNVGKTALALDILVAQRGTDVSCVLVVVGQPMSRVLAARETLAQAGCLDRTAIIAADASATPGLQFLAPYAGASVAESFREQGRHAVVVYDDLTKHADACRELALLLDRPPGREAYPGDIFYNHAELLERAAARREDLGDGSVTAFPLVETTNGDISEYIPTNLISITDGQIYLDTVRFERDQRPAIDIGRSVSRIGAVAQPEAMRAAARNLRIVLARFEALEALTRVGLDIDPATRTTIRRGRVLRELLRQGRLSSRGCAEQVLTLTAAGEGWLDDVEPRQAPAVLQALLALCRSRLASMFATLDAGRLPPDGWRQSVADLLAEARTRVPPDVKSRVVSPAP